MNWLNPLKNVPMDKQAHLWWGWSIGATLAVWIGFWALLIVLLAATSKEALDRRSGGKFDSIDILATLAGGWVGTTLVTLFG